MSDGNDDKTLTRSFPGKIKGASPSEDRYYVIVLFDISDAKKYRLLLKILLKYSSRVQKSVFEASLRNSQIKDMVGSIERLMASARYSNPQDKVRVYKIAGDCEMVVFGTCENANLSDDIFF